MLSFMTETVTRIRPIPVEDSRHNLIPSAQGDELPITGCSVQPGATAEDIAMRDTVTIRWTVYAPAHADITANDLIIWQGRKYQVNGSPERWQSPSGAVSHVKFSLVDWEG